MTRDIVLADRAGEILTITMNRPERRNAITPALVEQLATAFEAASADQNVRVVVLRGASRQAFSAGIEIGPAVPNLSPQEVGERVCRTIESCRVPVVAMLYGYVVGGGLNIAAACDFRIAAENVRVALTMVKIGAAFYAKGLDRMVRTFGLQTTRRLALTGKYLTATEALTFGIVDEVVPTDQLEGRAYDFARSLCGGAPLAISVTKSAINRLSGTPPDSALIEELDAMRAKLGKTEDFVEGRRAFAEKRAPVFKGI